MARRARVVGEDVLVEGLRGIEERVEGLLETFEISSDRKLLRNVRQSLREAQKGRGRTIRQILTDLEKRS